MYQIVNSRPVPRRLAGLALQGTLLAAIWGTFPEAAVPAQETKAPHLLYSESREASPQPLAGNLPLRPNPNSKSARSIYLFVKNPTEDKKTVTVVLRMRHKEASATGQVQGEEVARTELTLDADETKQVSFKPPVPPAAAPTAPPAPPAGDKKPEGVELQGSPCLEILLLGPDKKELQQRNVVILAPHEYLDVANLELDSSKSQWSVLVETNKEQFRGPPCVVELVLSASRIPNLTEAKRDGVYKQILSAPGERARLQANNLEFIGPRPAHGLVSLTVDGYERAFLFDTPFTGAGSPSPVENARVRSSSQVLYSPPSEVFLLPVEADLPKGARVTAADVLLEVALDRNANGRFEPGETQWLNGHRDLRVGFNPTGPDGALVFQAVTVRDWRIPLPSAGLYGTREYQVRLLRKNAQGQPMEPPLAEQKGTLVIDGTKPENLKFGAFPRQLPRGATLPIQAMGSDPESGISRVVFFLGKPTPEGQLPKEAQLIPAKLAFDKDTAVASAQLPMPPDKKGPLEVSVQFVNNAGLSAIDTVQIELIDPAAPGGASAQKLTIQGEVSEGGRLQPDLEVILRDDKGNVKGTVKTGKEGKLLGKFKFDNVMPGAYKVSATKPASKTKGEAPVTVETKSVEGVKIELFR